MLAVITAASLAVHFLVTWIMRARRYDAAWFKCRAIAESVKSLTWKYMMAVEPFSSDLQAKELDTRFSEELKAMVRPTERLGEHLSGPAMTLPPITDSMRQFRTLSLEEKQTKYLKERVSNQKSWYDSQANAHASVDRRFFCVILAVQLLALVLAVVVVAGLTLPFNATGSLTTVAATVLAWVQFKRYGDTLQTYPLAAHDLAMLESFAIHVTDQQTIQAFVRDVEAAISREHKLWYARGTGVLEHE